MSRQSTRTAIPVLLTRPEEASRSFATALDAKFGGRLRPVIAPLMAPTFLTPAVPEGAFQAVIFTSATAVVAAKSLSLPKRAYCVGAQTAAQAQEAGFQAVSANGDADALVAAILSDRPVGRLLHLRGQDTRGDVAERLSLAGISTDSVVVYRQDPQALTQEAQALLATDAIVIVPLFSPRSAALFLAAVPQHMRARLRFAVISSAVAKALQDLPHDALAQARRPDAEAMLEAVGKLVEMRSAP